MTNQNILIDNSETFVRSFDSSYKKIKAMIDIKGREANMAPQKLLRFAISEIRNIRTAELNILMRLYIRITYQRTSLSFSQTSSRRTEFVCTSFQILEQVR